MSLGQSETSAEGVPVPDVRGPHADADWREATVVVRLPVHGTATTTTSEVDLTLPQLAAALEAMRNGR
jgi:hypothetical protein